MSPNEFIQILLFLIVLIGFTPLLGNFMSKVFRGEKHIMLPVLGWLERLINKITGIRPSDKTNWRSYTFCLLFFNLLGFTIVFVLQMFQSFLPVNPQHLPGVSWHSSFNTAISFMTNTNWQGYAGETTLSYFVQMLGLTVQNFVSASTGIAVLIAFARGIAGKSSDKLGNFWVDLTRSTIYILLPLSIVLAIFLLGQGVIQNFKSYETAITLQGTEQVIPMGPVASQVAIKQLGTNGGGFFNANSAHPFENPTPFSNFLEMLSILLIPAALTYTYGKFVKSAGQGWTVFIVMFVLFIAGLTISLYSEYGSNGILNISGNMEGKETRFGVANSVLWSVSTSAASNGSANSMLDSLTPVSGMIALFNIMLGEVIFGGVGAGLYGIVVFIIITVFISGLMVGRTPEYLGKKVEAFEVKMAIIAVLAPAFVIILFSAWALSVPDGLTSLNNNGPHGLTEILYAFSSAAGNNGSAFAGLNANTVFYNILLGLGMIIGRFGVIVPVLAIAGSMIRKKVVPDSPGTLKTDNLLFGIMLIAVILIIGGLTFFPVLALGPVVEHFLSNSGITF